MSEIEFRPMTADEFKAYLARGTPAYAEELIHSLGLSPSEALRESKELTDGLLPKGLRTEGHFLCSIVEHKTCARVGDFWYFVKPARAGRSGRAYIYDFFVVESKRGLGYGTEALVLLEHELKRMGISSVGLNVFANNERARKLYEEMGFEVKSMVMRKGL